MPRIKLESDNPEVSFDLHVDGAKYVVFRNDGWELQRDGMSERLGSASLKWVSNNCALGRAIDRIKGDGK